MKQFRKKPVEVEAFLWGGEYIDEHGTTISRYKKFPQWFFDAINDRIIEPATLQEGVVPTLKIQTLEGCMLAPPGTWIIKGIHGELYPCKPDIFEKTYEEIL